MARLLFYECGHAPSTRSVRELTALRNHGWEITVAHLPGAARAVEALGFQSCTLPAPAGNPLHGRLSTGIAELSSELEEIKLRADELALLATAKPEAAQSRVLLDKLRIKMAYAYGRISGRTDAIRRELAGLRNTSRSIAAQIRALQAGRRSMTPLTGGTHFGDLVRLEPQWHDAAQAIAAVQTDVLWAADLDGLPPMIWASQAAKKPLPVVYDAHELFCDLLYLPELYRVGWKAIADRFIPQATAVITVSQEIAGVLEREHGARQTFVIPNYAAPGPKPGKSLRGVLQLDADTPLAVHIGHIGPGRNPEYAIHLLTDLPTIHVAFVGATDAKINTKVREQATIQNAQSRLHFVDPVPIEHLLGFVADANVSVIMYEGSQSRHLRYTMPNKLYDSLGAALPVVCPAGTSAGDFVAGEGLGRTFPFDVPSEFSKAVTELLDDSQTKRRVAQRSQDFIWTRIEPALCTLLDNIADTARQVS